MLKNEILINERTALETAIVVLQNRVGEIDFILRGGAARPAIDAPAPVVQPQLHVVARTNTVNTIPVRAPVAVETDEDVKRKREAAAADATARGEKFIAITDGVATKRVATLAKIIDSQNHAHYNIVEGSKVYAASMDGKKYLGKFSEVNTRGVKTASLNFYFKTAELQSLYTGL
jgi:hypothetical protein